MHFLVSSNRRFPGTSVGRWSTKKSAIENRSIEFLNSVSETACLPGFDHAQNPSSISGWLVRLSDALRSTFPAVWFGAASCGPASFLVVVLFTLVWSFPCLLPPLSPLPPAYVLTAHSVPLS